MVLVKELVVSQILVSFRFTVAGGHFVAFALTASTLQSPI